MNLAVLSLPSYGVSTFTTHTTPLGSVGGGGREGGRERERERGREGGSEREGGRGRERDGLSEGVRDR